MWEEAVDPILRYDHGILLNELRKTMENLSVQLVPR
jgi:hypothetical protein